MPINKFNGFYYGVGLKLDEKSVNDLSKQIENKLNKTVDNVREEIASLQEAFKFGKDVDLKPLIASLNAAAVGIRGVNDADFNVLKAQVDLMKKEFDGLSETVAKLGINLDNTAVKFTSLVENLSTKIDRFMSQPSTMRDNLKHDLRTMQDMAKYYSEALKVDPNASTIGLEAYFAEFKKQFGNIGDLSDIATREIAQDFLRLGYLLRKSGLPIDGIRSELLEMTAQLEAAFKLKNPAGVEKAFSSIGYQVDASEAKLASLQKKMQELEKESERLSALLDDSGNVKFNGGTLAKEDQILNLEEKIAKIKEYQKLIGSLDIGTEQWVKTYKNQISLIRDVEKEIAKITVPDDKSLVDWNKYWESFGLDEGESLASYYIGEFSADIGVAIDQISQKRLELDTEAKKLTQSIAELAGTQKKLNDVKTKRPGAHQVKGKIQEQYELNLSEEVNLKAKIDNEAWRKAINASISKIEQKIVPIKIKAELKDAEKVRKEITQLKNAQLVTDGTKKKGKDAGADKDAENFNKRFDNLLKTINNRKSQLNDTLNSWHKEFDKMFEFQFKVNGLKKDEYGNLSTVIANLVDSINTTLEDKPLKFTSNIKELAAKIQEQLQNIKIDNLQVGGISAGSIGAGGITSTGGIPMIPSQFIGIINSGGEAARQAAEGFKQAGQAAEDAGQKAQSKTENIVRTGEKQVEALLEAYGKLTDAQRSRIARKSPDFANAMADLEKNPTWDNYQKNILRFGDLSKIVSQIRPNDGLQKFIDKIQTDISEYDKLDDAGKAAASRSNNYVQSVVEEYFKQIAKKGKANASLASNKDLLDIFTQLKANPTYENYKKLLLSNTKVFADVESSRPTSRVQDFINLLVSDQKAYEAAFGKPVVESAAVQQNRQWFENGKQIVQYIIQLAEMASKIAAIRSKSGVEITDGLFKDGELSKWISGRQVSKDDIGAIIGKKDISNSDVDKFLANMKMTRENLVDKTDPYLAEYMNPLLSAINNFKEKQGMLDKALAQLTSGKPTKNMQNFVEGFGSAESKEAYLTDNLKWLQTISKKGATTNAQKYIVDTFKNNKIDISALKSAKTQAEQWQIIQDQILNNPQVDFNKLMTDLRAGKGNFTQAYSDFVEIIGIAKRFVTSSDALSNIGQVANKIIDGEKITTTKKDGTQKTVRVNGLRGELNKYGVVISGENGSSFGYREGQATVENGLFGNNNPFTKIAKELAAALQNAVDIAFSKNKVDGLDVKPYKSTTSEPKATYGQDLYFNRDLAKQRRDYYQSEINKLNARLQAQENNYKKFATNEGLKEKLYKNSRFVELEQKFNSGAATDAEKLELTTIIKNAQNELSEQTKRLAESIQKTKDDLAALTTKLNQSKKDYKSYNSQIKKQEKEFKQGTYQSPKTPSRTPSGSSSQPAPSGGEGFYLPGGTSGGLAVLGGSADIATESTVRAIYNALVGNGGEDNPQLNTRIETLEKAIAEIENAAKAQKESQKQEKSKNKKTDTTSDKKEFKKKDETTKDKKSSAVDKKVAQNVTNARKQKEEKQAEEQKKLEEQNRKAIEEAMAANKAKAEATKKAAEEERKAAVEAEKAKSYNKTQKEINEVRKATQQQAKTANNSAQSHNQIQQSLGKTEKELFAASNKYVEEVNSFMQIFREHQFAISNGKVTDVKAGLLKQVGGIPGNYPVDTRGHMHPGNSLYSATDIKNIATRKQANPQYNRDLLITPDNVFEISDLKNVATSVFEKIAEEFNAIEHAVQRINLPEGDDLKLSTALKFTALNNSGIKFNAYSKNDDGSLVNITDNLHKVSDQLYKNVVDIGKADLSKGLPAKIIQEIKDSSELKTITAKQYTRGSHIPNSLNGIISTIQHALDNNLDLNPLNTVKGKNGTVLEILMREFAKLEGFISKDSPYYEIKSRMQSNGSDPNFMNNIRPLLEKWFKVGDMKSRDTRADAIYNAVYGSQGDIPDKDSFDYSSLADMKTELAFLKSMQSGKVVQFATEAKQDQIISILQGGIKVKGVDGKDAKKPTDDKEKKQEKNLPTSEQARQAQQAIGTMSKEASVKIDSTGKQTIHTIQKIGVETAKVTQVTEDGVTKSTLELSNKYETAMKSLFQKIRGDSGKYLFGAETVRFGVETTEAQDTLLKYVDTYRQLEDAMEQYKKSGDILLTDGPNQGKQLQTVIDELQVQLGEYEKRLISISNASQSFLGGKTPFAMLDGAQLKDSANSLKLLASSTEPLGVAFNGVYNNGKKLLYDVLDNGVIKSYSLEVDEATGNVRKMEVSQTALVNALQNVNKAAKQGEELKNVFLNDDVNQSATVIQNYKNAYKEMNDYVHQAWETARQNGGLIPIDEQDKIYAMSQEVLRLGATIQKEYKRIATIRDSGTPFESLGQISNTEEVETKMRQYLNRFAEGQTLQVSNLQYDSVTQSMTADLVDLYGVITKVKLEYNELLNSVNVSSAKGTNSIDDMSTKMINIGDNIDQALGAGVINKNLDEYKAYAVEVAKLDELIANIENGTIAYNVDAIQQWNAQRQAVIDTGKALSEVAQINAKKSLPGVRAVESQSNKKIKIDNMIETIPGAQDSGQYQSYIDAYEKLLALRERFRTEGTLGLESNQKQLQVESDKVNQLANSLSKLLQQSAKIRSSASDEDILKLPDSFDVQNLEAEMKKFVGISSDATKEQWKFNNATNSASYVIKGADNVVSEMTVSYDVLTKSLVRTTNQQYKVKSALQEFADSVGNKFKELGRYLLSFGSFYEVWNVIRQGVTYVREIDSALTELKKVTDATDASYDKFLQNMSKTGSVIGATVADLTTSAADWARLGYSMQEAGELAKNTSILMNVSEFEDVNQATETLISALQAFKKEGQDVGAFSMEIIDKYNEVGNSYAISTSDLAESLTRSSAALVAANNSLEQSIAMTAAANTTIQDPESVGNALKTVSMRIRGVKTELEEAGEDTSGMVTNTAKLQEKIMALTNIDGSGGVDILTRSGDFKSTYDILLEISKVWDKMNDVDQAALLELVAGKTRGSVVAALFQNGDVLEDAYKSATDASGSAMRELNNHLDSIQGRIDLFNNSLQTMWMNFIDDDVVKRIVDLGTALIKVIDLVNPLNVALAGLFGGMFAKYSMKKNNTDILDLLFETTPAKIKSSPTIQNIVSTVKDAFNESMGRSLGTVNSFDILAELANFDDAQIHLGDLANIFGDKDVTRKQAKQILDSFDDISDVTKEAILNSNLFAVSQTGAAAGTNILTASLAKAKAAAIAFRKGLMAFAVAHPIIAGLTAAVIALGAAFAIYDAVTISHDEYIEKLEEETEALKSIQSELQTVQSELKTTSSRMDELQAKGTLSFVEEEELNRLKEQTAELERQEEILIAQEKRARNKQIQTALNAAKTDKNLNKQQSNATAGVENPYLATSQFTGNTPYAAGQQNEDPFVATSQFTGGTQYPSNQQVNTNKYESTLNALKTAKEDLEKAETELVNTTYDVESKEYKKLEKAVEKAQGRVDKYNNTIDSMDEAWKTQYGEVGYIENATTAAEKQWNEYYRQHQDYLDQQALINNDYGKDVVLDRVFGATGTDIAQEFKKEFESAIKRGQDPSEVIEKMFANKNYSSAFSGLEKQFGITIDNIKSYFTQTGEFAIDPEFDITKYSHDIKSHSAVISEFQEALQKLGKGTFTMDDFIDLSERFPDLAKGVDISSNAFHGLSRNLQKAIRTRTKSFVNDLKKLKESLVATGKSTDSIDQLIEAIESMPDDALDSTIEKYVTLADEIERARIAQDKLSASMEENPNEGYETRGEALDYMKEAMSKGEIGSESNLWNVAQKYGFTYDSAKTINENADALARFIAVREKWWKTADDGDDRTKDGYSFEGTKNFIESVEKVVKESEAEGSRLSEILKWNYDEKTGAFDFDYDNKNLAEIISLLSQTEELVGINESEWMDLMVQIGQYFNVNWGDANDVIDHINKICEGSGTAADKIDEMTDSVETYVEKALGIDLDFSNLTQASIDALDCDDSIKQLLKTYLTLKQSLEDPLSIETKLEENGTVDSLLEIKELQSAIRNGSDGYTIINTDAFTTVLQEAGYTEDKINDLINKIQEYKEVITVTNSDPLGLNSQNSSIATVMSSLKELGIQYELTRGTLSNPTEINITAKDLITTLQEKGWTAPQVAAYLETLTSAENGLGITVDGKVTMNKDEIDAAIAAANQVPEKENTEYTVSGTGVSTLEDIVSDWNFATQPKSTNYSIYETTYKSTVDLGSNRTGATRVNGTAHAQGTAYSNGSWGASQTETSLVGELGPEILVRNGRWTTVGDNGAEFTQVKKGDIIFNHKQTESLLKNGYVTGRGKAYASGTAYASGGGTFTPYNPPIISSGGNNNNNNDNDDSRDDAEQLVDFIEMKLEEIEAIIEKTTNRITNFLDDTTDIRSKDELYDELIRAEKEKSETYLRAVEKYSVEAAAALSGVPQQYQEMARNGAIEIKDFIGEDQVEIAEAIEKYRELAAKADEAENGHLEAIAAISAHRVEQLEDIATDFENIVSISKSHSDLLQAEMDFIEESGNRLSEDYYEELKRHSQKQLDDMQAERAALQKILDDSVAAGDVVVGSDDWYSMLETIYEVDQEIIDCKISLEEFQNAINDLYWDNFDKLIDEIDNVDSELSNLYDLVSDADDIVDDTGNWTDDGIAAIGLLSQQMENAQFKSQQYGEAIAKLKEDYNDGLYSTDEYNEKLAELTDGQYDAIKSYENAKEAIVDLNKTRVDAVKDGMQKEIDAYSELIEKKKESLNSDKEAREFENQVQESNKNIKDLERKIAALEGNTSSSAVAQRKRLEAELLKAREELNELYYNHSIDKQQEALDKELEDYTQNKQDQMDALDEYLKNEEQVIADSFDLVTKNTEVVADTLIRISEEYGVTISDTIATPWINGANAIGTYEEQLNTSVSVTTANLETLKQHLEDLQAQADETAESIVAATHATVVSANDGHQTSIKGYAKGSKSVEYDQWAIIDELGDELQLVPNKAGRLDYIKKGTGILNNTLTDRLIDLAMDPTSMLESSRPAIGTPGIATTNNTITIDASVGTLLHVERLDGSNPAEVAKLVDKAWEKKMQTLNNSIKKFTR